MLKKSGEGGGKEGYDLAVIGGRTIGSYLAKQFGDSDYDVLLVEKEEVVGEPLACSGHYSPDLWEHIPRGEAEEEGLVQNEIKEARFKNSWGTYRLYQDDPAAYVVDRKGMDQLMFEKAGESGVETETGVELVGWDEDPRENGYNLELELEGRENVYANIVAGCDGPSSTVRRLSDLEAPKKRFAGMMTFIEEDVDQEHVEVYLDVPSFFGWRIPRNGETEYGLAMDKEVIKGQETNLNDYFREFVEDKAGEEPGETYTGPIPLIPPSETVSDYSFLVGDAAGQNKPYTGGGILYGLRASDVAAEIIDPDRPETLEEYDRGWRDELQTKINLGRGVRKVWNLPEFIQHPILSFASGDMEKLHLDEPETIPGEIWERVKRVWDNT